jgi:adenosylmethionine---8-amino-7-oxononanoate aminotransferase
MSLQYWRNLGDTQRKRFIGFDGGYHGDTVGAMSAGGSSAFWTHFRPLMFDIDTIPFPATFENDRNQAASEQASLDALQKLLSSCGEQYAAIIIEPLVQGAAGMRMCSERYLQQLEQLARKHGVLLIFDEVMTGFGRTGDWFACTKSKTSPDLICLSKGITGGFLPLAVTVATEKIYQAFFADELEKAFFHSHSYTGNPIACAAGVASMRLLERNAGIFQTWEPRYRRLWSKYLAELPIAVHPRFCGTLFAFDLDVRNESGYFGEIGPRLRAQFLERGLLLRPLGNTIYLMPPYCTDDSTLESVFNTIRDVAASINCSALAPAL